MSFTSEWELQRFRDEPRRQSENVSAEWFFFNGSMSLLPLSTVPVLSTRCLHIFIRRTEVDGHHGNKFKLHRNAMGAA